MTKLLRRAALLALLVAANLVAVPRESAATRIDQHCQWMKSSQGSCVQGCTSAILSSCGLDPCWTTIDCPGN